DPEATINFCLGVQMVKRLALQLLPPLDPQIGRLITPSSMVLRCISYTTKASTTHTPT
ncbi:hypothetical protein TorRG33x02_081360, partial [Trema orientale]